MQSIETLPITDNGNSIIYFSTFHIEGDLMSTAAMASDAPSTNPRNNWMGRILCCKNKAKN